MKLSEKSTDPKQTRSAKQTDATQADAAPPESTHGGPAPADATLQDSASLDSQSTGEGRTEQPPRSEQKRGRRGHQGHDDTASSKKGKRRKTRDPRRERRITLIWGVAIIALLSVELYVFGKNGAVRACVGKKGVVDFSSAGERAASRGGRVPSCATRYNLGMTSHYDERKQEALYIACRRVTLVSGERARAACFGGVGDWVQRVQGRNLPPWHPKFYRELFWFLF